MGIFPDLPIGGGSVDFELQPGQDLVLRDSASREILRLDAETGLITIRSADGAQLVRLEAREGNLKLGGSGVDGDLLLYPGSAAVTMAASAATIRMNGELAQIGVGSGAVAGAIEVGGPGHQLVLVGAQGRLQLSGAVEIRTLEGGARIRILPTGTVIAGGDGQAGQLRLTDGDGDDRVVLNAASAACAIGGNGEAGSVRVRNAVGETTFLVNGETGNVAVGGATEHGMIFVKAGTGSDADNVFVFNGERGDVVLGRDGRGSDVSIRDDSGLETLLLRGKTGNIAAGRSGLPGNVFVKNAAGVNAIHLSGETGNANISGNVNVEGDVRLANADCAEEFPLAEPIDARPGTVMVLDDRGSVRPSRRAYDPRVVGVVSGAGPLKPAIVLDARAGGGPRAPLALTGKVYCKVDAREAPIRIGDLLTTAEVEGHARRATEPDRAFGAVIGKALEPLDSGCGLILILAGLG